MQQSDSEPILPTSINLPAESNTSRVTPDLTLQYPEVPSRSTSPTFSAIPGTSLLDAPYTPPSFGSFQFNTILSSYPFTFATTPSHPKPSLLSRLTNPGPLILEDDDMYPSPTPDREPTPNRGPSSGVESHATYSSVDGMETSLSPNDDPPIAMDVDPSPAHASITHQPSSRPSPPSPVSLLPNFLAPIPPIRTISALPKSPLELLFAEADAVKMEWEEVLAAKLARAASPKQDGYQGVAAASAHEQSRLSPSVDQPIEAPQPRAAREASVFLQALESELPQPPAVAHNPSPYDTARAASTEQALQRSTAAGVKRPAEDEEDEFEAMDASPPRKRVHRAASVVSDSSVEEEESRTDIIPPSIPPRLFGLHPHPNSVEESKPLASRAEAVEEASYTSRLAQATIHEAPFEPVALREPLPPHDPKHAATGAFGAPTTPDGEPSHSLSSLSPEALHLGDGSNTSAIDGDVADADLTTGLLITTAHSDPEDTGYGVPMDVARQDIPITRDRGVPIPRPSPPHKQPLPSLTSASPTGEIPGNEPIAGVKIEHEVLFIPLEEPLDSPEESIQSEPQSPELLVTTISMPPSPPSTLSEESDREERLGKRTRTATEPARTSRVSGEPSPKKRRDDPPYRNRNLAEASSFTVPPDDDEYGPSSPPSFAATDPASKSLESRIGAFAPKSMRSATPASYASKSPSRETSRAHTPPLPAPRRANASRPTYDTDERGGNTHTPYPPTSSASLLHRINHSSQREYVTSTEASSRPRRPSPGPNALRNWIDSEVGVGSRRPQPASQAPSSTSYRRDEADNYPSEYSAGTAWSHRSEERPPPPRSRRSPPPMESRAPYPRPRSPRTPPRPHRHSTQSMHESSYPSEGPSRGSNQPSVSLLSRLQPDEQPASDRAGPSGSRVERSQSRHYQQQPYYQHSTTSYANGSRQHATASTNTSKKSAGLLSRLSDAKDRQ
ncbi:hypothetical protein BOTBODRAFT_36776 [Botryobasidium botryosum FD-172 SS1]|uniref:Uncharacterized protein n=1 Tax=Botryobasidium botryosum (strain FD-172 SS1) TaxID=930990 RepID=A0A067M505_BOTB1|nr:hypothetical protein BOTBODRAFT_36776 [Botryobasidium botryosum FD-172 SS1]